MVTVLHAIVSFLKFVVEPNVEGALNISIIKYCDGQRAGWPGFDSRQVQDFLFSSASRPPGYRGVLSPVVKATGV
jgi:hypothetical protein